MTIFTKQGIFKITDFGFMGCLAKPLACGCGHMAAFVRNRFGATRCLECDDEICELAKKPGFDPITHQNARKTIKIEPFVHSKAGA